jgi:hypothetical protein
MECFEAIGVAKLRYLLFQNSCHKRRFYPQEALGIITQIRYTYSRQRKRHEFTCAQELANTNLSYFMQLQSPNNTDSLNAQQPQLLPNYDSALSAWRVFGRSLLGRGSVSRKSRMRLPRLRKQPQHFVLSAFYVTMGISKGIFGSVQLEIEVPISTHTILSFQPKVLSHTLVNAILVRLALIPIIRRIREKSV